MIVDIMEYVCKCPAKDTAKAARNGKLCFAKRPFPDRGILITAHIHIYTYSYMPTYTENEMINSVYMYIYVYTHTYMQGFHILGPAILI